LIDANHRVYVIWRVGLEERWSPVLTEAGHGQQNLVYRVLDQGEWSKVVPINQPGTKDAQYAGGSSFFATVNPTGKLHVVWNAEPDKIKPSGSTGYGVVWQATLDGAKVGVPREIYMTPMRNDPSYGPACDDLDGLDGYFDVKGAAHFLASTYRDRSQTKTI